MFWAGDLRAKPGVVLTCAGDILLAEANVMYMENLPCYQSLCRQNTIRTPPSRNEDALFRSS